LTVFVCVFWLLYLSLTYCCGIKIYIYAITYAMVTHASLTTRDRGSCSTFSSATAIGAILVAASGYRLNPRSSFICQQQTNLKSTYLFATISLIPQQCLHSYNRRRHSKQLIIYYTIGSAARYIIQQTS
jgi:hypothetical protein